MHHPITTTKLSEYQQNIVDYYRAGEVTYRDVWDLDTSMAIHFGYWDEQVNSFRQSLVRFNEILAEVAHLEADDRVLDAGCGVGGSSIYLAQHIGCEVVGITLSAEQVATAKANSLRHQVAERCHFEVADYCQTPFEAESFDVVWALESVCYAESKQAFLQEAYRLLKKGGRLIVADGFASKRHTEPNEQELMQRWVNAWAVKELAVIDTFCADAVSVGFKNLAIQNITKNISYSSKRLYYLSLLANLAGKAHRLVGRSYGNVHTINNGIGAYHQYKALQKDLWRYYWVYAEK